MSDTREQLQVRIDAIREARITKANAIKAASDERRITKREANASKRNSK